MISPNANVLSHQHVYYKSKLSNNKPFELGFRFSRCSTSESGILSFIHCDVFNDCGESGPQNLKLNAIHIFFT